MLVCNKNAITELTIENNTLLFLSSPPGMLILSKHEYKQTY